MARSDERPVRPERRVAAEDDDSEKHFPSGSDGTAVLARALQGGATRLALGTISAALLDLAPRGRPRLGALVGAVAPLVGLAAGALGTGLLVQYGPAPRQLVYWLLFGAFALAIPLAASLLRGARRETAGSLRHALRPTIGVPASLRLTFLSAVPCLVAAWALGGLVLALGPSLTASVLHIESHVTAGLAIFLMTGVSAIASVVLQGATGRTSVRGGLTALIVGVGVVLAGLDSTSLALFLVGSTIAGLGFGPAFSGAFKSLANLATAEQRAGLVSSILAVAYLAFSLPAIAAGAAVTRLGLHRTADVYAAH
jgi:hypothetical protein